MQKTISAYKCETAPSRLAESVVAVIETCERVCAEACVHNFWIVHPIGFQAVKLAGSKTHSGSTMLTAVEALNKLKAGNNRFATNVRDVEALASQGRRNALLDGQTPVAIILGCSDSRVPAELVFDQGFGDLFVIRVAGNVVAPSQVGSVEFAVQQFDTPLVVVLGHSQCGAVLATINELEQPDSSRTPNLWSIVDRISPAVATLLETPLKDDRAALEEAAIRANIRLAADHLRHGSRMLEERISDGRLMVVGAEYSLETGHVEFFDGAQSLE